MPRKRLLEDPSDSISINIGSNSANIAAGRNVSQISNTWLEQEKRVEHPERFRSRKQTNVASLKGKIDFGIISIKEEEFEAVIKRFKYNTNDNYKAQNRTYVISRLPINDIDQYTIAIVRCIEQGTNAAHDTARDMIEDLDPGWILLVGIGGAVPAAEFTLGDVVIARRLHDFCIEENLEEGVIYGARGGPMEKEVNDIISLLKSMRDKIKGWNSQRSIGMKKPIVDLENPKKFYGSKEWRRDVKEKLSLHYGPDIKTRPPGFTDLPVASSDRLIKSTITVEQWRKVTRDVGLFEMELTGVYEAAHRKGKTYPVLAIRGISDIVGFKRSRDWTNYACNSAAAFAHAFIGARIIEPKSI